MNTNFLVNMARQLLEIEGDLPYRFEYRIGEPAPLINDFELYTFEQVWGDTTTGFGGIGGQAMTSERTYVLIPINCNQKCFVYFGGRFAYTANYCEALKEDIRKQNMASVQGSIKYKK